MEILIYIIFICAMSVVLFISGVGLYITYEDRKRWKKIEKEMRSYDEDDNTEYK